MCLWCLCSKPEGGRRIKRKKKIRNYIYFPIQLAFHCIHSFSFQGLRDREVPGEVKERHTCMLERQRASKGEGEKTEKETKHDRGRGVIARCLRAVNHSRKPNGLLWSELQSEKWNGNEEVLFPAANKCTPNILNEVIRLKQTWGKCRSDQTQVNMRMRFAWRLKDELSGECGKQYRDDVE